MFYKYVYFCNHQHNNDIEHIYHLKSLFMYLCSQYFPPTSLAVINMLSISITFARIFKLVIISFQNVVKIVMILVLNLANLQGSEVMFSKTSNKFVC